MTLDKTFASGDILSAADVNSHLLGIWIPIDKRVIASGSPVASVSFASIDSNFRLLRLTLTALTSAAALLTLRLNNDSGNNYNYQQLTASGVTISGQRITAQPEIRLIGSSTASEPIVGEYLISKPVSTVRAMVRGGDASFHTVTYAGLAGNWANTSALINRVDVLVSSGTFYGVVALEGMRGV